MIWHETTGNILLQLLFQNWLQWNQLWVIDKSLSVWAISLSK